MFKSRHLIAVVSIGLGIAAASGCVRRERVVERERPVVEREVVRERPTVEIREAPRETDRIEVEVERR